MLSLAILNVEDAEPGTEVTLVWGGEGSSSKPTAERHVQTERRTIVGAVPYSEVARKQYHSVASSLKYPPGNVISCCKVSKFFAIC
jgi:hypothetical protein